MFSTGRDFRPHGIPVAALSCGRWVRGGEPDERVDNTNKNSNEKRLCDDHTVTFDASEEAAR